MRAATNSARVAVRGVEDDHPAVVARVQVDLLRADAVRSDRDKPGGPPQDFRRDPCFGTYPKHGDVLDGTLQFLRLRKLSSNQIYKKLRIYFAGVWKR